MFGTACKSIALLHVRVKLSARPWVRPIQFLKNYLTIIVFLKIVRGSSPGREVSAAAAVVGRSSRSRRRRQPPQHDDEDHDAEDHDDGNHQPRPAGPGCAEGHGVAPAAEAEGGASRRCGTRRQPPLQNEASAADAERGVNRRSSRWR